MEVLLMSSQEIPLQGGNVTGAVRVGNTVRRATGPWSSAVHSLLQYLERRGFDGAPQFLGIDSQEREILSFIEGEVGNYPLPLYMWSEAALVAVARFLRRYHDATLDFVAPTDAKWQSVYPDSNAHEVICHNDVAPYNMVYVQEQPHALIDFDYAGPGPRAWDMAYAAYRFVPLLHTENQELQHLDLTDPPMQKQRLQRFCAAYGISTTEVLALVEPRLQALCTTIIESANAGNPAFQKMLAEGHLAFYQREIEAFHRYYPHLSISCTF